MAADGLVAEGSVGAGTGMVCYGYKGGVGTASRQVVDYLLGILLVANFGRRDQLTIRGLPVGRLLQTTQGPVNPGSVMTVLATNAPLTDRQLGRIARRTALGLARTGSTVANGSGDFVIAFSTAQTVRQNQPGPALQIQCLPEVALDNFFRAAVEATEEAVLNALCQATPVTASDGFVVPALPIENVRQLLQMGNLA
jgi:D-aminopeptidase